MREQNLYIPRLERTCIVRQRSANEGTCRSPCAHVPQALLLLATTQLHDEYLNKIKWVRRSVAKFSRAAAWNVDDRKGHARRERRKTDQQLQDCLPTGDHSGCSECGSARLGHTESNCSGAGSHSSGATSALSPQPLRSLLTSRLTPSVLLETSL